MNEVYIEILKALHEMGGVDAKTDYDKGWDDAITASIDKVQNITGVTEREWLDEL